MSSSDSGGRSLRQRLARRTLAVLEMPLAVLDTTLDHKVSAIATARELVAHKIRSMDADTGAGIDGGAEPVSSYEPPRPAYTPPAPAEKKPAPNAEAAPADAAPVEEAAAAVEAAPEAAASQEEAGPPPLPFEDYDSLNVHKISRELRSADEATLDRVEAYEAVNKNRKTILQNVQRRRDRLANPIDVA